MGQALHINGGLVSQIGTAVLNFQSADVVTALGTTLTLGGANAVTVQLGGTSTTALNIGTAAQAKTIQIGQGGGTPDTIEIGTPAGAGATINLNGNVTVRGTQHVIGDTTFDEDITLGDAVGDAITLKGTFSCDVGRFNDIKLAANAGSVRQLYVADSAAGGTGVSILAGTNSTVDGAGASVRLVPSAPNGAGTEYGKVYFGATGNVASDRAYMLLTNATASVDTAGLRFDNTGGKWQLNNATGGWVDIATGPSIGTGSEDYQHLEWDGSSWQPVDAITLPNVPGLFIKPAANGAGSGQNLVVAAGEGSTQPGGSLSLRGGVGTLSTNGMVYLGDANTVNVYLGDGTDGFQFDLATRTLVAIGTGSINLDTTGSRLEINGTAVSGTGVTAANFDSLFDGSNVTCHTHSGLASSSVIVPATSGGTANRVCYVSAADALTSAIATGVDSSRVVGVCSSDGNVQLAGTANNVPVDGTLPTPGQPVYLSVTTAGSVQKDPPSSTGQYIVQVGICKSAAAGVCSFYIHVQPPIAL